jgi:hypothetical protein
MSSTSRARRCLLAIASLALTVDRASAQDLVTGLRGHWKLTETSGTTAADQHTTPHNGTYTNGVTLAASTPVPADGAVAASFDGVNDYVAIGTESYFDTTGPITVSCWIKVDVWDTQWQAIVTKGDSSWRLLRDSWNNGVTFACSGLSTLRVSSTTAVNDGKWHHILASYTGSYLAISVDGVVENSVSVSGTPSTNNYPVNIGRCAEAAGREFDGSIYDVRIYHRALGSQELSYLYLMGGPVGHWKFNHASGTTVVDSSLYGRNGAITGTTAWSTRCNGTRTFDFNGSTYASVTNASQLQPTAALTVAGWVKADSLTPGDNVNTILRKGEATPNNYALSIADGKVQLLLDAADAGGIRGNTTITPGQWYHVAGTWNGSQARLYVNGLLDNTPVNKTGSLGTDTRALYMGGRSGATDMLDGMLHDIYLYDRALSAAEVANLAGLPGYWKFSEGTGTTAADSTGSANNATLLGSATWTTDCAGNKALLTNSSGGVARTNAAFAPPSEGTVAFWMQPTGGTTLRRIFGTGGDWEVRQQPDNTLVFDICGEGGATFVTTEPLDEAGRWYHVAANFNSDNDTYAVYVDGELQKAGVQTVNMVKQPSAQLSFGTRTGSTEYWPGALRDFRVYSRQLCPSEIADLAGLAVRYKLDETAGSVVADSSGAGRNASVVGTATWTAGKVGNAIQLNGATSVTASASGLAPRNVTIAAWANLTSADSSGAEVISLGDYFAIRLDGSGASRAFFYNGTSWQNLTINQTFAGAGWRHFAAVFDDDNNVFRFYVNGAEVASMATAASISWTGLGSNIVVGRHGNGNANMDFTGRIDDARIYTRALCPAQVLELVNDGGGAYQGIRILQWVETR